MRGDATYCHEVDFGLQAVWGVQRYFEEQLDFFNRWLPDDAPGQPPGEAPVRIFVMGGGSGRKTAGGKLDHGGRWREEQEWPLARAVPTSLLPARRRRPLGRAAGRGRRTARVHLRPGASRADARRPLLLDRRAAGRRAGDRAGVGAAAEPGAAPPRPAHARPGRPEGVAGVLRLGGAVPAAVASARTCSSTRPSR